jgi:hypothetical protein
MLSVPKRFLLIGDTQDATCEMVATALERLGHIVILTATPLAAPFSLRWRITNGRKGDVNAWGGVDIDSQDIAGVLLRPSGGIVNPDGWNPKDLAYMQTETQAALIAWACDLKCPVINRPSADLWFRPQRTYVEWHWQFIQCKLPVVERLCVTNDIDEARAYALHWEGRATYAPLTSPSRYSITEPRHWDELAKVIAHVPVCLLPPTIGRSTYVTVVGDEVVWDQNVAFDGSVLEPGLVLLARVLRLDFIQVELATGPSGVNCITADPYPLVERHDSAAQSAIVANLVDRLQGDQPSLQTLPPEVINLLSHRGFAP